MPEMTSNISKVRLEALGPGAGILLDWFWFGFGLVFPLVALLSKGGAQAKHQTTKAGVQAKPKRAFLTSLSSVQ